MWYRNFLMDHFINSETGEHVWLHSECQTTKKGTLEVTLQLCRQTQEEALNGNVTTLTTFSGKACRDLLIKDFNIHIFRNALMTNLGFSLSQATQVIDLSFIFWGTVTQYSTSEKQLPKKEVAPGVVEEKKDYHSSLEITDLDDLAEPANVEAKDGDLLPPMKFVQILYSHDLYEFSYVTKKYWVNDPSDDNIINMVKISSLDVVEAKVTDVWNMLMKYQESRGHLLIAPNELPDSLTRSSIPDRIYTSRWVKDIGWEAARLHSWRYVDKKYLSKFFYIIDKSELLDAGVSMSPMNGEDTIHWINRFMELDGDVVKDYNFVKSNSVNLKLSRDNMPYQVVKTGDKWSVKKYTVTETIEEDESEVLAEDAFTIICNDYNNGSFDFCIYDAEPGVEKMMNKLGKKAKVPKYDVKKNMKFAGDFAKAKAWLAAAMKKIPHRYFDNIEPNKVYHFRNGLIMVIKEKDIHDHRKPIDWPQIDNVEELMKFLEGRIVGYNIMVRATNIFRDVTNLPFNPKFTTDVNVINKYCIKHNIPYKIVVLAMSSKKEDRKYKCECTKEKEVVA